MSPLSYLLASYPGSSPCRKAGREPGRSDHVPRDILSVVLCVVLIIELLPTQSVLSADTAVVVCCWDYRLALKERVPGMIFQLVPRPNFRARVWTLSLWKLGQVYIRLSVNWVIVGVNYIISYRQRLLWRQKICKLAICDDDLLYLNNLIGVTTCQYARMITPQFYQWTSPDPIFRQVRRARAKNLVSGDETISTIASTVAPSFTLPRRCFVQTTQEAVALSTLTALAIAHCVSKESLEGLCEQLWVLYTPSMLS